MGPIAEYTYHVGGLERAGLELRILCWDLRATERCLRVKSSSIAKSLCMPHHWDLPGSFQRPRTTVSFKRRSSDEIDF